MSNRLVSVDSVTHQLPLAVREALAEEFVNTSPTAWAAWSGTANRTSRATSTATTVQVAEALKALVDDLKAAGVI